MKYATALAAKDARRPLATCDVPPTVWAHTWTDRPIEVVTVGLRSLSESVLSEVVGAAQARANRCVPGGDERSILWADEYNQAVRTFSIGRALCQPDCVDVPWWDYPDMLAPVALSPDGAAWLYARLSAAMVTGSVLGSDEDAGALLEALGGRVGTVAHLPAARRAQVVRHLRAALDVVEGR